MMKKLLTGICSGLLLTQAALAETPAVYRDEIISISGGALIDEGGTAYYRNIELFHTGDGNFRIAAAELAELADVESVDVTVVEDDEAEVLVQGTKSACVAVLEPAVSLAGNEFTVVLPLSEPESDVCILVVEEFEFTFQLDLSGLEPGTYTVVVNEVEAEFELE